MMRVAVLAVLLAGCAFGTIRRPDGTSITGVVVGAASLEACEPGGVIGVETHSADGAMIGGCARIDGGTMSSTFGSILSGLVGAASVYFSGVP